MSDDIHLYSRDGTIQNKPAGVTTNVHVTVGTLVTESVIYLSIS